MKRRFFTSFTINNSPSHTTTLPLSTFRSTRIKIFKYKCLKWKTLCKVLSSNRSREGEKGDYVYKIFNIGKNFYGLELTFPVRMNEKYFPYYNYNNDYCKNIHIS